MIQNDKKRFYKECRIAGVEYHDCMEVWDKLTVGTKLYLERDGENKYDPEAVAVTYFDKETEEDVLIGYIPREENSEITRRR